jgi:hypothetical protein
MGGRLGIDGSVIAFPDAEFAGRTRRRCGIDRVRGVLGDIIVSVESKPVRRAKPLAKTKLGSVAAIGSART